MSIKLTSPILYAGAHVPVDGATLSYAADLEADLVNRNMAVYVSNPAQGGLVPVMASKNVTGRIGISAMAAAGFDSSGVRSLQGPMTRPTVMAIGSSLVSQNQVNALGAGACPYYAHIKLIMSMLGQPWRWVDTSASDGTYGSGVLKLGLFGWGTGTSAQIAPNFDTLIKPHAPNYCFFHTLDNDTTGTAEAVADIVARHAALFDSAISAGITPIVFSGGPSSSIDTSAEQIRYWAIHRGIEALIAARPEIIYIPLYQKYTDTSATYGPAPLNSGVFATYTDGIHPRLGSYEIAQFAADIISARIDTSPLVIPTPGQAQLISANNMMCGSTAGGSGITGNVPAGFVSSSGLSTATVTCSIVERYGKQALKCVVSTSDAQTGYLDILQLNRAASTVGWSIGDFISLAVDIEFDPSAAIVGVNAPQMLCAFNGAATTYPATGGQMVGYTAAGDQTGVPILRPGMRLLLESQPVKVPASGSDNVTGVRPYFYLKCVKDTASVATTFYIHSFSVINHSV